jgi:hypothetical protein
MKIPLVVGVLAAFVAAGGIAAAQSPPPVASPSPSVSPSAAASPAPAASATPPAQPVPAGIVPPAVTISLAGTVTPAFVTARIRAAIDALADRQPGTTLDIHGITLTGNLAPGSSLDALAGVAIGGRGVYADATGKTSVHVTVATLPPLDPAQLFYSDDPEYIAPGDDGVLFRGTIAPDAPVRLLLYHVAKNAPRRLELVLQTTGTPAVVQLLGAAVGPNPEYAYVGQQASARFLLARALGESELLDVAPDVPLEIPLGTMQPSDLIEAIDDLRVVSGGDVTVSVVTAAGPVDLPTLLAGPELPDDSHARRGIYALAGVPPIDLSLTVGEPDHASARVGMVDLPNLMPGGRALAGDYGVVRKVQLHVANPTTQPQSAYVWERTEGGGGATVTMLFAGENAATTIPCVDDSVQPRLVRAFLLAPGTTQTIAATFVTDGASSYPVELGLSLTPPLAIPPGACNGPR